MHNEHEHGEHDRARGHHREGEHGGEHGADRGHDRPRGPRSPFTRGSWRAAGWDWAWVGREWRDEVAGMDHPLGGERASRAARDAVEELRDALSDFVEHAVEFATAPLAEIFRGAPPPRGGHAGAPQHDREHPDDDERRGRWQDSRWRQTRRES